MANISKDLTHLLLKEVRKRPGMYLMNCKLISLKIFITGYGMALSRHEFESDKFLQSFADWFISVKGMTPGTMWYPAILEDCGYSEERALDVFWGYLERFDNETSE